MLFVYLRISYCFGRRCAEPSMRTNRFCAFRVVGQQRRALAMPWPGADGSSVGLSVEYTQFRFEKCERTFAKYRLLWMLGGDGRFSPPQSSLHFTSRHVTSLRLWCDEWQLIQAHSHQLDWINCCLCGVALIRNHHDSRTMDCVRVARFHCAICKWEIELIHCREWLFLRFSRAKCHFVLSHVRPSP